MSGREVDVRWMWGGGANVQYVHTKLESEFFYWSRRVVSLMLRSGVQNYGTAVCIDVAKCEPKSCAH